MVTLERTMAAAVRQGRDSWCQSGASPPEGVPASATMALAEGAM